MSNSLYIYVIFSILFIVLVILSISIKRVERWTQKAIDVVFLSKQETATFLEEDKDKYVTSLSLVDLYARKSNDAKNYISKIKRCASSFTDIEKTKLIRCSQIADKFLKSYIYQDAINGKDIAKIQWKFAITRKNESNQYEEGLPHTRSDIIFLSEYVINDNIALGNDDTILTNTLIHEKVHIYQRQNELVLGRLIAKMGYNVASNIEHKLRRSNPDIDNKTYYDRNGNVLVFEYSSAKPENINDVKYKGDFSSEHPYERIAYEIANEYTKSTMKKII